MSRQSKNTKASTVMCGYAVGAFVIWRISRQNEPSTKHTDVCFVVKEAATMAIILYPHNQTAYNAACTMLADSGKAAVSIRPTLGNPSSSLSSARAITTPVSAGCRPRSTSSRPNRKISWPAAQIAGPLAIIVQSRLAKIFGLNLVKIARPDMAKIARR